MSCTCCADNANWEIPHIVNIIDLALNSYNTCFRRYTRVGCSPTHFIMYSRFYFGNIPIVPACMHGPSISSVMCMPRISAWCLILWILDSPYMYILPQLCTQHEHLHGYPVNVYKITYYSYICVWKELLHTCT